MPTTLTPLRYPGGKTKFYTYVREIMSKNNLIGETYIEPFAGGSGLAIKLLLNGDVKRIVINDFDPAIYAFWYSILYHSEEFCKLIIRTPINIEEWKIQREVYLNQNTENLLELGFATFYLNRTNVSGIIKGGVIGGLNQNGKYKMDVRFNKQSLIHKIKTISDKREQIIVLNLDAKELLQPRELGRFYKAFINLDPPYVKKGEQLYKNSFLSTDHQELYNLVSNCGRKWIVTYDVCPFIANLYHNFRKSYLDVTYSIKDSKKAKEYIFFSDNLLLPQQINLL